MRWWIVDAYRFGQVHARAMPAALAAIQQPAVAETLGASSPELNLLHYIGRSAIASELSRWLASHPHAYWVCGKAAGDAADLLPHINPLLREHCGLCVDQLQIHQAGVYASRT